MRVGALVLHERVLLLAAASLARVPGDQAPPVGAHEGLVGLARLAGRLGRRAGPGRDAVLAVPAEVVVALEVPVLAVAVVGLHDGFLELLLEEAFRVLLATVVLLRVAF